MEMGKLACSQRTRMTLLLSIRTISFTPSIVASPSNPFGKNLISLTRRPLFMIKTILSPGQKGLKTKKSWCVKISFDQVIFLYRTQLLAAGLTWLSLFQDYVRNSAISMWHLSGSVKMGRVEQRDTCVDKDFRVVGVKALRVVDLSVAPLMPT